MVIGCQRIGFIPMRRESYQQLLISVLSALLENENFRQLGKWIGIRRGIRITAFLPRLGTYLFYSGKEAHLPLDILRPYFHQIYFHEQF